MKNQLKDTTSVTLAQKPFIQHQHFQMIQNKNSGFAAVVQDGTCQ